LERRFRRSGSSSDKQQFHEARSVARDLIYKSRADVLKAKVIEAVGDSKKMWNTARQLLHSTPAPTLCDEDCAVMSNTFCQFFIDKVARIKQEITEITRTVNESLFQTPRQYVGSPLVAFTDVTSADVLKLLCSLPNKSSPRDVLPTPLLKSCADVFAPLIAHLMNRSFADGTFPTLFKTAQVLPLLKKPGLNRANPCNFRPISNLNTISKVMERLVMLRLRPHLQSSSNFNPLQSAYRVGYSTETAVLKMLDSFYSAVDDKKLTTLISLDISAAFDTISHATLLKRLEVEFGVEGKALRWLQSYLTDRCQFVKLGRHCSKTVTCCSGVPQGSVLGPLLFVVYVSPVGDLIKSHGVSHHQYADDTQLFLSMKASSMSADLAKLESCSQAVRGWFAVNNLMLNADKSDVMLIGTSAQLLAANHISEIVVAGAVLKPVAAIKSLGVTLDSRLTFAAHVTAVCKACNYHIWALRHIRHLLTPDVANTLACSIVGARIDYCNSILYGASTSSINKLQRLQNSLARVVMQQPRRTHAEPLLRSLHWLSVEHRVTYKLAVLTFNVRHTATPDYLSSLISNRVTGTGMSLRSSSRSLMAVPRTKTVCASRSFSVCAPVVWNSLPPDIQSCSCFKTFKSKLKTFLFRRAYDI
jgi:hypothetical protein